MFAQERRRCARTALAPLERPRAVSSRKLVQEGRRNGSAFATRQHLSIHSDPGAAVRAGPAMPDQDKQPPVEACVSAGGAHRNHAGCGTKPRREDSLACFIRSSRWDTNSVPLRMLRDLVPKVPSPLHINGGVSQKAREANCNGRHRVRIVVVLRDDVLPARAAHCSISFRASSAP
jgi:hypothetical protein